MRMITYLFLYSFGQQLSTTHLVAGSVLGIRYSDVQNKQSSALPEQMFQRTEADQKGDGREERQYSTKS